MKLKELYLILSGLTIFPTHIRAAEENQCVIQRFEEAKFDGDVEELADCVLKKNCEVEDRAKLCPWAFKARTSLDDGVTFSNQLKTAVEDICNQCESLAIISCGKNLEEANSKFNYLLKVFVIESANSKPLIFGYSNPSEDFNNLNLKKNLDFLLSNDKAYSNDLNTLTTELSSLSRGVNTDKMLTDNLQKSAEIVNDFRIKWSGFLRDLEQFSEIAQRLDEYSDDWRVRISSLTADDGCKPFQTTLDEGLSQSDRFSEVIGTISDEINSIRAEERLNLISRYSETSIKLNYVQTTSSTLAALEQRLGNVLRFNAKIIEANTFRFDVELGGLAGRLHTNYHQYAKPMKILSNLYAEGIKLVKALESFNGVSQSKKSAAIQSQNALNNEILMDIEWLEEIGWKGQFNWQILTAKGWFSTSQRPECKKLSGTYLTLSNSVNDNYAKFENSLEPLYLQVAHLCEAF